MKRQARTVAFGFPTGTLLRFILLDEPLDAEFRLPTRHAGAGIDPPSTCHSPVRAYIGG
jgi:hypothetical protein